MSARFQAEPCGSLLRMTPYAFAVIVAGLAMGLWLDRLLPPGCRPFALAAALASLAGLLLAGQDWAAMALGCVLGARAATALRG